MAGYSGTPLAKKLGIATGSVVLAEGAPANYMALLDPLPEGVTFAKRAGANVTLVHGFFTRAADLEKRLRTLRGQLDDGAAVWVSWPKKSAKALTDITEDHIRDIALPMGFVDVKVCAVDETWSGLKLMVRRELRAGGRK